jgi:hypothetical protein
VHFLQPTTWDEALEGRAAARPPLAAAGPPPVPDVPGQWPVPYYHEQASTQSRLM